MIVPDFLIWHCAGCGAAAKGNTKPCHCATNVGSRNGPNGEREYTCWDAPPPTALDDIAAERRRQIEVEGWTPEHDDQHGAGEMSNAAAYYALSGDQHNSLWPWDWKWCKRTTRRRDLVKAGALIVAEIERLDRATAKD